MKIITQIGLMFTLAITSSFACADFIKLPTKCSSILDNDGTKWNIAVSISDSSADIVDESDIANMICQRQEFQGLSTLVCEGTWISDGSKTKLSVNLSTFLPMISIQRSQALFQGEIISGFCLP